MSIYVVKHIYETKGKVSSFDCKKVCNTHFFRIKEYRDDRKSLGFYGVMNYKAPYALYVVDVIHVKT